MVRQQRRNSRRTLEQKSISNVFDRREDDDNDTYNFRILLYKILDIFEASDKHQLMKHTKQISGINGINVDGQELNSEMMRIKIGKNEYKSLKEFQDDFISIINNATLNNKENYDSGMKLLQFGSRLIEQAVKDVPPIIKGPQKIALMQPTTNGYVFSSVTMKQPILNNKFELVGELKEKVITPQESMSERDIPTLGSVLTKKINKSEQSTQSKDTTVPGVYLNSYKPYGSFAPIYNSRGAILSYEDTMMTYSYKQGKKDDIKNIESTLEKNNIDHDVTKSDGNILINSNSNESNEPTIQKENLAIAILDENVVMFARLQMLQNKRFQTNPDIISSEEKILSTKLRNRLAEMISVVPPSKLVSPGSIEKAMSQLPSREAAFKGTLPPDNNRAYPSNEVSRDAFNNFISAVRPSETTSTYSPHPNSQMGNPQIRSTVMGPPPPPQSHPPQLKSEISRTQPQTGYLHSQLMSPSHASRSYLPMNPQHGIPRQDGYYPGYHGYPTQYSPHLQRGYSRPNVGNSRSHIGNNLQQTRPGY
ncbi:723_t:CDS:2 [Diversispora eburnea]|uniref:723_t:CDS:1 n=1 Tax=Diversispora eburnea TaxID=1213867 RepID=A0A9N9FN14_9GLOM|nr:723_t:CDS:2 [Diversispora eburnea]